ncbi:MAG: MBL fold metallo-hydrolase [Chloroflexi bacterium]|nr:MBL fold metallo-hydrolase [Chloroflexota bacterium]
MVDISEVAENIYMIDNRLYSIPEFGSTYLLDEDRKALVDPGPATSASVVLDGIRQAGFRPEDIAYIIVTHIHLDHAGGAGVLLRDMPRARVVVHHRGARHLVDPSKLISSVIETQGEQAMVRNGPVVAIEESTVQSVFDGDTLKLGDGQVLSVIDAPGHVSHELCIFESRNRGVFVGDAVGNFVAGRGILVPITPPSSFDLELYVSTLQRLMKLDAAIIYFSHFGTSRRVKEELEMAAKELRDREAIVNEAASEDALDRAAERIIAHARRQLEPIREEMPSLYDYWADASIPMSAAGHMKYYRERHNA